MRQSRHAATAPSSSMHARPWLRAPMGPCCVRLVACQRAHARKAIALAVCLGLNCFAHRGCYGLGCCMPTVLVSPIARQSKPKVMIKRIVKAFSGATFPRGSGDDDNDGSSSVPRCPL
nr:hypothetical protein CFP56_78237 [Quercus suber]